MTDTESEADSFGATYTSLLDHIEEVIQMLETAETALHQLQRPLESLALQQLGDVPFLQTSPFRQEAFSLKRAPATRLPFHAICSTLRAQCLPLTTQDRVIQTSPFLREQLNVSAPSRSFLRLLGALPFGVL